jgi:isopentenyl-diphosphate delta-isomerase
MIDMPEEWIDVVDSAGVATGVRKLKRQIHRDGDLHLAVHVWIVSADGRVLLQRRSATKENYPGLWDVSSAGHLSAGETSIEAALRETAEELGLQLNEAELVFAGRCSESVVLDEGRYLDHELHDIYLVRRDVDPAALQLDAEEVADVALIPLDALRRRVEAHDPSLVPHDEGYAIFFAAVERH